MAKTDKPLSKKKETFCLRVVAGDDGAKAARAAGYAAGSAHVAASRLKRDPAIMLRIDKLKTLARAGVQIPAAAGMPDVTAVVLSREYLLQRLVQIQHDQRDAVALNAIKMIGQEEFQMFFDRIVLPDPAKTSTDDLAKLRDKIRRKHGLVV